MGRGNSESLCKNCRSNPQLFSTYGFTQPAQFAQYDSLRIWIYRQQRHGFIINDYDNVETNIYTTQNYEDLRDDLQEVEESSLFQLVEQLEKQFLDEEHDDWYKDDEPENPVEDWSFHQIADFLSEEKKRTSYTMLLQMMNIFVRRYEEVMPEKYGHDILQFWINFKATDLDPKGVS